MHYLVGFEQGNFRYMGLSRLAFIILQLTPKSAAWFLRRLILQVGQICYNKLKVIVLISKGSPVSSKWLLTLSERDMGTLWP